MEVLLLGLHTESCYLLSESCIFPGTTEGSFLYTSTEDFIDTQSTFYDLICHKGLGRL